MFFTENKQNVIMLLLLLEILLQILQNADFGFKQLKICVNDGIIHLDRPGAILNSKFPNSMK